jgi:NAD(P)-dependent dehydrogenase (short-subunit alcohol dehydrogenase family)
MKWTLVTGGAKGLGREICLSMASQGHHILVHYRSSRDQALQVVDACRKQGVDAEAIQGNFSSIETTQDFIEKCLKHSFMVKNLVNNVGNYVISTALNTSETVWHQLFQSNFHAPCAIIRGLIPSIKQSHGSIVNIGVAGISYVFGDTYSTAYSISKLALWMLTKSLARELASSFVRVNMVSPGYLENAIDLPKDLSTLPMKRVTSFGEVVRVIAFLLDETNRDLTGQNIEVAGGVRL